MIKILKTFFVVLGVIFFALLLALTYFFVADPYNLRPILGPVIGEMIFPNSTSNTNGDTDSKVDPETNTSGTNDSKLSPSQMEALQSFGVDPDSLPTTITPSQESCFVSILGQARVDEIKGGATPSATEFFKTSSCLK